MTRIVLVLVASGVMSSLLAWWLPSGWLERLLEVYVGTDLLMLAIIGFIALMQWLTLSRGWSQDSSADPRSQPRRIFASTRPDRDDSSYHPEHGRTRD